MMKLKIISIPFVIIFLAYLFGAHFNEKSSLNNPDSFISVKLSFVGDIMCHSPQIDYANVSPDSFDFRPTFRYVKSMLSASDLTFGNFETVTAGKKYGYSGYPLFNSPDQLVEALNDAGFDVLFTSNNHSIDKGINGLNKTIEVINKNGIIPIGTYNSKQDSDSLRIINVRGITIGLLAYTYGLNGNFLPKEKSYSIKLIDTASIKSDIKRLQKNNPDIILVYFHFGEEYLRKPSLFQKEIVNKTILYGADLIIASHPHVLQPIEYFNSSTNNIGKGIVAYSLGNFISNQRWQYSDAGVILNVEIAKHTSKDSTWLKDVNIVPTWVFKGKAEQRNEFIVLPADSLLYKNIPSFIKENELKKLNESYKDAYEMFNLR